jgi:hypothetical protein
MTALARPRDARYRTAGTNPSGVMDYLAVSGGGSGGGILRELAGGLVGSPDAPEFDVVAGVSTGALIAPLAFLGSAYDPQLKGGLHQLRRSDRASR